jgi:hypothetical protein
MFVPVGDVWRSVFVGYERTTSGLAVRYDTNASRFMPEFAHLDGIMRFHFGRIGFTPQARADTSIAARATYEKSLVADAANAWRNNATSSSSAAAAADTKASSLSGWGASLTSTTVDNSIVWGMLADPIEIVQLGALVRSEDTLV